MSSWGPFHQFIAHRTSTYLDVPLLPYLFLFQGALKIRLALSMVNRTRVSSPKQSSSPFLPLRRVAQKVTDVAAFSSQSSLHSSRSSLSEEAEAGSVVSSLVPVPPPVLNSHSQNSYVGNANSSLPRRTTFVGDSPPLIPLDTNFLFLLTIQKGLLSSTKPYFNTATSCSIILDSRNCFCASNTKPS